MKNFVVTLIGPDRPGLVEAVSEAVASNGGNWLESRMAHLAGKFAGILHFEAPDGKSEAVRAAIARLETAGLRLIIEAADAIVPASIRNARLELVGQDRPGIVKEIAQFLAAKGINVEELATDRESAAMSGESLFRARARIRIPGDVPLAQVQQGLERIASDLLVEIRFSET